MDMSDVMRMYNGMYNTSYVSLVIRKTNDPVVDKELKKFVKETLAFLKEIRNGYRGFLTAISTMQISMGGDKEDFNVQSELVDAGIKYDYQKKNNESYINCFINYETIAESMPDGFSMTKEEAEAEGINTDGVMEIDDKISEIMSKKMMEEFFDLVGTPVQTDQGELMGVDSERLGFDLTNPEEFVSGMEEVLKKKVIYKYLKKLDVFDDVLEMIEAKVDFFNVLHVAADKFSEKYGTGIINIKSCVFNDGQIYMLVDDIYEVKKEHTVQGDYLMDEPDKEWYVNLRDISITPYSKVCDEEGISIGMGEIEAAACFKFPGIEAENVTKCVDKICRVYAANCRLAEENGEDPDDLPLKYRPHVYVDGEMTEIETIAMISDDFKLLEIPFTPDGLSADCLLTEYPIY